MNAWAKRGSMSHAKYVGMRLGKKRNQIANHAAAAAPRMPQPNRDRRAVSIPTLPSPDPNRALGDMLRLGARAGVSDSCRAARAGQTARTVVRATLARTPASCLRRRLSRPPTSPVYGRLMKQKQYSSKPPEPSPGARKCSLSTMWLWPPTNGR